MATDALILGPFEFTDFSIPDRLPGGGRQQMHIHRMPGGERVIDCLGPDDIDRIWSGLFFSQDAEADALTLDAMRRAGEPLAYSNGMEARTVVILEFLWKVRKQTCIEYDIACVIVDNDTGGGGGFGISSLDAVIGLDLAAAVGLL